MKIVPNKPIRHPLFLNLVPIGRPPVKEGEDAPAFHTQIRINTDTITMIADTPFGFPTAEGRPWTLEELHKARARLAYRSDSKEHRFYVSEQISCGDETLSVFRYLPEFSLTITLFPYTVELSMAGIESQPHTFATLRDAVGYCAALHNFIVLGHDGFEFAP